MQSHRYPRHFLLAIFLLFAFGSSLIPPRWFFSDLGQPPESKAAYSSPTRAKTVEFFIGQFSADGTTGKNTNTNNTLPNAASTTIRLVESNVVVKNAYVEYEFQFSAYSGATINSSTLTFDACVASCAPDAWSGTGRASTTDSTTLETDSGESNTARMYLNVTNESQIANYKGSASGSLAVQAGYRFRFTSAANNIANASAKLVITYTYDESSPEVTNTIIYPLESQRSGDRGTQGALAISSCTVGSDCPAFSYNMILSDLSTSSNRLAQWFYLGGVSRANTTADQTLFAQIGANAGATTTLEEALGDNDGGYYWYFSSSTGFLANATQTLNVKPAGTNADMALVGGEVVETYRASSSAATRMKTVRYGLGEINTLSNTTKTNNSVNVFFPESGVSIKKAWVRLTTSFDGTAVTKELYVSTKVGSSGSESASTTYLASCGVQCVSNDIKIFHVLPSSTYATLAAATAVTSTPVTVYTEWETAKGAVSGELLITYSYTGETGGYQVTHSIFAGQATSSPATSVTFANIDPALPDTGGTLSVPAAFLEANMLYSEADGVPTADPQFGASMASTTCSVGNSSSTKTSDTENTRFLLHKDVSSAFYASDSVTYKTCYASNSTGKFSGTLVYTYQNAFPNLAQASYHWRNDDDFRDAIVTSTLDALGGTFPSLALTSSGIPVVAYVDSNSKLRVLLCGNTECSSGNTTSSPDSGTTILDTTIGILIRSDGKPLISYGRSSDGNLIFLNCGNSSCSSGNVTSSLISGAGYYSSMDFNSSSNPVILSYHSSGGSVRLYRCGNATCSSGNSSSSILTETSAYHSLALSSDDLPNMSFYSAFGLRFGHCTIVACASVTPTTLHNAGVNQYTSLALDANNIPSVAYFDSSNNIRLYRCDDVTCSSGTSTILSSGGAFSGHVSLALGSSSLPFTSYALDGTLRLAHCGNQGCSSTSSDSTIIDQSSFTGFYSSLELDTSYNPAIVYQDAGGGSLRFAKVYLASSATGGIQNTAFSTAQNGVSYKLRIGLDNIGAGIATSTFRLEYGLKTGGSCEAIGVWTTVGAPGDSTDIVMASSSNMTNGSTTLDISRADGGVTSNQSSTFTAGETKNTTSTTSVLSLSGQTITELEFAIKGTVNSTSSNPYCFRLTKAGTALDAYTNYPQIQFHSVPTVASISVNNSNPITLIANTTTTISVNFQISDSDGCSDVFTSGNVTTTLYRTSKTSSCEANTFNCYKASSVTVHSCSPPGTSANATTTFYIQYFADATDASSSYTTDSWRATIDFVDSAGLGGSSSSATTSLSTLVAIDISTSSLSYGTVTAGSDTSSTNQTVTIKNAGNSSTTLKINGTALTLSGNSLATSSQHYATSSFTFGGSEQALSDTATTISGATLLGKLISPWVSNTALPNSIVYDGFLGTDSYLYVLGGRKDFGSSETSTVWFAPVSPTGTVGSWATTTPLLYSNENFGSTKYGNYIYVGGGANGTSTMTYAFMNSSGTLGSWATTTPLPYLATYPRFTAYNNYLYLSGGYANFGLPTSSVFYAPINANGSIGSWATTTPLDVTYVSNHGFEAYDGYLYFAAGSGVASQSSSFAVINANGTIGSWTDGPQIGLFSGHTLIPFQGVLYSLGGSFVTTNQLPTSTPFAVINSTSPKLSNWSFERTSPHNLSLSKAARSGRYVYLIGGSDGSTATSSLFSAELSARDLYFGASVSSSAKVGTYTGTNTFTPFFTP